MCVCVRAKVRFVTWSVLAVVLVELDQNRRGHHEEIPQGRGDRVGDYGEPLAQTTQALEQTQTNINITHKSLSG